MTRIGLGGYLILHLCKAIQGMILVFLHAFTVRGSMWAWACGFWKVPNLPNKMALATHVQMSM